MAISENSKMNVYLKKENIMTLVYNHKKEASKSIRLLSFFSIFFLTISNSTFYQYYFSNLSHAFVIIAIFLALLLTIYAKGIRINANELYCFVLFLICFLTPSIINGFNSYVLFLLLRVASIYLMIKSFNYFHVNFFEMLDKVIFVFSLWSILNYFICSANLVLLPVVHSIPHYDWNQNVYGFVFIDPSSPFNFKGIRVNRLCYPFSEPGVAQLFFNYGIIYCLFISRKKNWKRVIFYSICVLMTISSIGILIFSFIVVIYLFKQKKPGLISIYLLIAAICASILIQEKKSGVSYNQRTFDLYISLFAALKTFPVGKGYQNELGFIPISNPYGGVGFYCGLIDIFIDFGLFGLLYYICLIKACKGIGKQFGLYAKITLALLLIITVLTEPIQYCNFYLMLIDCGMFKSDYSKIKIIIKDNVL